MQLVEQHVINRNDPRYAIIDEAAFKSKNLYNAMFFGPIRAIDAGVRTTGPFVRLD
jgi:hypothetical protein